tara:strand:+ start:185 stop:1162 length:978 start_codon:yes stop_codon:yes gene_type:complete
VCYVSNHTGIGHLSRLLALANELNKSEKIQPEFLIFGDYPKKNDLLNFKVHNYGFFEDFPSKVDDILKDEEIDILIFDLYSNIKINNLAKIFKNWKENNLYLIGIDSLLEYSEILDLIWIPSFNFDASKFNKSDANIKSGWDSFLIQKRLPHKSWTEGSKVLILTGGSDITDLGKTLPSQLDKFLGEDIEITWVKGPLSNYPVIPKNSQANWIINDSPDHLDELILQSNYVMTIFGVSFFEVIQYGVPTVVFSPYENKDDDDLNALEKENVALVTKSPKLAIDGLFNLMNDSRLAKEYSKNALKKNISNGATNLSNEIYSLMKSK